MQGDNEEFPKLEIVLDDTRLEDTSLFIDIVDKRLAFERYECYREVQILFTRHLESMQGKKSEGGPGMSIESTENNSGFKISD